MMKKKKDCMAAAILSLSSRVPQLSNGILGYAVCVWEDAEEDDDNELHYIGRD